MSIDGTLAELFGTTSDDEPPDTLIISPENYARLAAQNADGQSREEFLAVRCREGGFIARARLRGEP